MRYVLRFSTAVCLLIGLGARARAAEDDCRPIIEKAIKAYGGADQLAKLKAFTTKSKATLEIMGMTLTVTVDSSLQLPGRLKTVMDMEVAGQKINLVQVFNKDKAWAQVTANGQTMNLDLPEEALKAMKESGHGQTVSMLTPLLQGKAFVLSPLGEVTVQDRTAVGVKVTAKGHKDVNLFFDKETGLLVKQEGPGLNTELREVNQEVLFSDYKDVDGFKRPMKLTINQDGKKLMEVEVSEYKFVDKIDDSEFAKP